MNNSEVDSKAEQIKTEQIKAEQIKAEQIKAEQIKAEQTEHEPRDKQVCLPEPDRENITVLTPELPNEPILPWLHFDSPWLDSEAKAKPEQESESKTGSQTQPEAEENPGKDEDAQVRGNAENRTTNGDTAG